MAMDPVTAGYIWIAVFFIGLVVFFMGIFRKYSPVKMNPVLGAVVGVCLIIPGFIWGIMPNFPAQPLQQTGGSQTIVVQQGGTTVAPATFDLDPSASTGLYNGAGSTCVSTAAWNAAETIYTVPLTINEGGTAHYAFTANYTGANFTITPVAPAGATNDDLATIYFETEYTMTYSSEDFLNVDGNGVYWANWYNCESGGLTYQYSGSLSMTYTQTKTLQVGYQFDTNADTTGVAEAMSTVGDSVSWTITFHNIDWTWSESFTVLAIVIVSA